MWLRYTLVAAAVACAPCFATAAPGCGFDAGRLSFAGTPSEQALCLTRTVLVGGILAPTADSLPATLAELVGRQVDITREAIRRHLASRHTDEAAMGGSLDEPVSHANGGEQDATQARYFVMHDTSAPYFRDARFPLDLDGNSAINGLDRYRAGGNEAAHLFINRRGDILVGHDLSVPWRATKLENAAGVSAKGLFLHFELLQPRTPRPERAGHRERPAGARAGRFNGTIQQACPCLHDGQPPRRHVVDPGLPRRHRRGHPRRPRRSPAL